MRTAPVVLLMFASVCMGQQTKPKFEISVEPTIPQNVHVDPSKRIMPQMAADAYLASHVDPMVDKVLHDTGQPASLRALGDALSGKIRRKDILYEAVAAYYPGKKEWTYSIDYRIKERKYILYAFVPALKDFEKKWAMQGFASEQIAVLLTVLYAHEEIHYKLSAGAGTKYPLTDRIGRNDFWMVMREEAEATGTTILELFRPILQAGGKLPQDWIDNSETFKKVGDNSSDIRWIGAFAKVLK